MKTPGETANTISNEPLHNLNPHYTDGHYKTARTVWIASGYCTTGDYGTVEDAEYNYSDRIWQWDWNKADAAWNSIGDTFTKRSPAFLQEWLRGYFNNPKLELVHIMAGFNVSTGYPYQVFGYITHTNQKAP